MRLFFEPRSVALVGVSSRPSTLSSVLLNNLKAGYPGRIYLVNPHADSIGGLPCVAQVGDLPPEVDLALLMVPASETGQALRECATRRVRRAVVIAAGFAETGEEGADRERAVAALARQSGLRLIGPNSMGVMNLEKSGGLNATFSPVPPRPGNVAFITQSGALGVAVLSIAERWRIGFSQFVSLGNEADVTAAELLDYCAEQPGTRVVLLYLESLAHGEQLLARGRRLAGRKPLVLLHAGRTEAGAAAAASHTGALATRPGMAEGVFERAGFLVARSLEEMLEMAAALSLGRVPGSSGRSIAILTNAGGPGVLATDTAVSAGLHLASLRPETRQTLREHAPAAASVRNPVDLLPAAGDELYLRCAQTLLSDPAVEQLLVLKTSPPLGSAGPGLLDGLAELQEQYAKPVEVSLLMAESNPEWQTQRGVPCFWFPESAARAAAALARYAQLRQRPEMAAPPALEPAEPPAEAAALLAGAAEFGGRLPVDRLFRLLACYGIPVPEFTVVSNCREAARFAEQLGYPVAVKTADPDIVHKADSGGVWLDIREPSQLCRAFAAIPRTQSRGVLVQRFVHGGHRELLAGFIRDERLGPLLACGLGGTAVEALGQVAYLALPASPEQVREMIASLPGGVILGPFRGKPPVDLCRVVDVLAGLARLGLDHPQILTVEINPLLAAPAGEETLAVDARLTIAECGMRIADCASEASAARR